MVADTVVVVAAVGAAISVVVDAVVVGVAALDAFCIALTVVVSAEARHCIGNIGNALCD